tara:strand:+ start:442 stop:729 length:288 start_codon:yes stop_codon:yes gene_type:complete
LIRFLKSLRKPKKVECDGHHTWVFESEAAGVDWFDCAHCGVSTYRSNYHRKQNPNSYSNIPVLEKRIADIKKSYAESIERIRLESGFIGGDSHDN